jgi:hypothetical protein
MSLAALLLAMHAQIPVAPVIVAPRTLDVAATPFSRRASRRRAKVFTRQLTPRPVGRTRMRSLNWPKS